MKRVVASAVSAISVALVALLAGACDDAGDPRGAQVVSASPRCGQYSACGTCTPALGCGWCMTGAASGLCVDDPGDCPTATTVGWTWDPGGCHAGGRDASVLADASIGVADAGADVTATDATPPADARSDVY